MSTAPETQPGSGRIAAIVLAAGRSSRFEGGNKLLAGIGGEALIRHVLAAVASSSLTDIVLVLSSKSHDPVLAAAGAGRWKSVINGLAESGLASSLKSGLAMCPEDMTGVLVVLGDMPGITGELIALLLAKAEEYPGSIVYPATPDGRQGHPVYWPADIAREFGELSGDQGAKPLLRRHAHRIVTVPADDRAVVDIDTVADLEAYRTRGG